MKGIEIHISQTQEVNLEVKASKVIMMMGDDDDGQHLISSHWQRCSPSPPPLYTCPSLSPCDHLHF